MKHARGKLEVFMQHMVVKYEGMITEDGDRISIFDEKTDQVHSYPSQWCHIIWDKKIAETPSLKREECIHLGCRMYAISASGYCRNHSLYESSY